MSGAAILPLYGELQWPVDALQIAINRARGARRSVADRSMLIAALEMKAARDLARQAADELQRHLDELERCERYLTELAGDRDRGPVPLRPGRMPARRALLEQRVAQRRKVG